MEGKFVQARNVRLQYYEDGDGPETMVLVHGYASSAILWKYTIEALAESGKYRIVAINNRGAGDSDRTGSEDDYTVQNFASDLHNAVSALGLSDFILVGHSMGGATVTQFALNHQDMLRGLVLLNSAPLARAGAGRQLGGGTAGVLRRGRADPGRHGLSGPPYHAGLRGRGERHYPAQPHRAGHRRPKRSMGALRLRERLGEIKVPTMVVGGDRDTTVGVDNIVAEYLALPEANSAPAYVPRHRPQPQRGGAQAAGWTAGKVRGGGGRPGRTVAVAVA